MKKLLALVLAAILFVVLIVVILDDSDEDLVCTPLDGSGSAAGGAGESGPVNAEGLANPITDGEITSAYRAPDRSDHEGSDFAVPHGTPIHAMADGEVVIAEPNGSATTGFGNWIVIEHEIDGKRYDTVYGHMYPDEYYVSVGDRVEAGQHIGDVGSYGDSSGDHLHFELHEDGHRDLAGGHTIDPGPWISEIQASTNDNGSGGDDDAENNSAPAPGATDPEIDLAADSEDTSGQATAEDDAGSEDSGGGGSLPTSETITSEDNLQSNAVQVARAVADKFDGVDEIHGFRDGDDGEHGEGRAVDVMIPDYDSTEGKQLGDDVFDYLHTHREHFNIEYLIWRQNLTPTEGEPYKMEDRGNDNENHYNHVHITVEPSEPASESDTYSAPDGSGSAPEPDEECIPPANAEGVDVPLNDGEIPDELVPWIERAGRLCREAPAPLVAGLMYHESMGFQATAVSPVGASGYGQFMPDTWAEKGATVDENGEVSGPPGSGSPGDPADATMAVGRYLCEIADGQREAVSNGSLNGDAESLMLAGYNAGPGAVEQFGGVPPYPETQNYVVIVPEEAAKFEGKV